MAEEKTESQGEEQAELRDARAGEAAAEAKAEAGKPPEAGKATKDAPAAEAGGPYTCQVGEAITLDGDGSADPEGDALSYSWTVDFTPAATLAGPTPTLVCPTTSGTFNVTLAVTDLGGLSDIDGTPLSIEREPGGPAIVTDWTLPLLGLLLVAAVMLFMFFFWRRRKRQEEATKTPPPPNFPEGPPLDGQ